MQIIKGFDLIYNNSGQCGDALFDIHIYDTNLRNI